jgi:hypothetical protein
MPTNPTVFLMADGKRRVSATISPAPSIGGNILEIIYLDGFVAGDDRTTVAIIDLLWSRGMGVRGGTIENGELVLSGVRMPSSYAPLLNAPATAPAPT